MKKIIHANIGRFGAAAALIASLASAQAGHFVSDFSSGVPAGSSVYGVATAADGVMKLTTATGGQRGTFVLDDLDAGAPLASFTARFKVLMGGGIRSGADGMSVNFGNDVAHGLFGGCCEEEGSGSGIRLRFETYWGGTLASPAITASINTTAIPAGPVWVDELRANRFVDCIIQLNPNNTLDVYYDGVHVYSQASLGGYTPVPGSYFGFGARTGGSWDNHFIDNLSIATRAAPAPFVSSFAPGGSRVQPNSSIDIVLTDYSTQVDANAIALALDGIAVAPTVTQDGSGQTTIHYAPASAFAPSLQHSVSLTFADNATPPQSQTFLWQFTVADNELPPTDFVTVWSEDFESYNVGYLDKNFSWDPNYAPNGSGNPWFGPAAENHSVVEATTVWADGTNEVAVAPHSGTKMMTKAWYEYTCTLWANLAYRAHGGEPIKGNCRLDWWLFDANDHSAGANAFYERLSLYYYDNADSPATADWPARYGNPDDNVYVGFFWDDLSWEDSAYQSLALGGSRYSPAFGNWDLGKYQIRAEEKALLSHGIDGWVNTIARSQGWHHFRIVVGPPHANGTAKVWFYVDDMNTPVYSCFNSIVGTGFGIIEIDSGSNETPGFYDDMTFSLVQPPNIVATLSGSKTVLTWPGEGFTLQKAESVNGPWSDVAGAASGYSYNTTAGPKQFFRLKN